MNHGVSLFIGKRCKTGRNILKHFHKNTTQTTQHYMPEFLFILGAYEKFRTRQHRLHQDTCNFGNLHHTFKFKRQMLFSLDVKHHTAYIRIYEQVPLPLPLQGNPCDAQRPALRLYWPTQILPLWEYRQNAAMPAHNAGRI